MPAPQAAFHSRQNDKAFDPATLSDDEDTASNASRSTWASDSGATILGLVDGFVSEAELLDWKISRVGGQPSFPLSTAPPSSASHCLSCSLPMPLLSQLYVPLSDSALERVVYVFACPRSKCRKQPGSVRAFRASALWVEGVTEESKKAEEERRKEEEKRERQEKAQKIDLGGMIFGGAAPMKANSNPFAPPTTAPPSNPFALPSSSSSTPAANPSAAANPFASPLPPPIPASPPSPPRAVAAPTLPTASTSTWSTPSPLSYPAQYINTMYEPAGSSSSSSSTALAKHLAAASLASSTAAPSAPSPAAYHDGLSDDDDSHREGKGSGGRTKKGAEGGKGRKDGSGKTKSSNASAPTAAGGGDAWGKEGYEVQKVKGVDEVFLRFQERVAREGRQVLRYEYSSQPLPFSASSAAYRSLFPPPSSATSASSSTADASLGLYAPSFTPRCKACGSPSAFEYQLMPHLVSVLEKGSKGKGGREDEGVEFATVWVFGCVRECVDAEGDGEGGKGMGEAWREEGVMVEWEEET